MKKLPIVLNKDKKQAFKDMKECGTKCIVPNKREFHNGIITFMNF